MLQDYIVTLASGQQYRFHAEDEDHAREQAENAEPDNPVVTVERETELMAELRFEFGEDALR